MKKRCIAIILSVFIVFSSLNLSVFAGFLYPETVTYENESEWLTSEQMDILYITGVSPWKTIADMQGKSEAIVSRAEAAWHICNLMKLGETVAQNDEALFRDLSSTHEYYGYIKAAVDAGLMLGGTDGFFRPNEAITAREAATVLVRALGYGPYIKMIGIDKAFLMTDIFDGVPMEGKITHPQMLRMMYNALKSQAIKSEDFRLLDDGTVDITYSIDSDYIGFQHILNLKYNVAVLDAIPGTTLVNVDTSRKDGVIGIAGNDYEYDGDATAFLGYLVNYIYQETDDGRRKVVYMSKSEKNKELVLTHNELDSFSNGTFVYEDGNNTKEISIKKGTRVVYNGLANPGYDDAELNPEFGTVTFINNDSDSDYDVVVVDSCDFYVSSTIVADEEKIYVKELKKNTGLGKPLVTRDTAISFKDVDLYEIWNKGQKVDLSRLKAEQLLVVRESSDNSVGFKKFLIEAMYATRPNAKIEYLNKESVGLGGEPIKFGEKFNGYFELGEAYNFYIYQDEIVFVTDVNASDLSLAYLINYQPFDEHFDIYAKVALIDLSDYTYQVYDMAEKFTIDGYSFSTDSDIKTGAPNALLSSATLSTGTDGSVAQPVYVGFNKSGEINRIDTYAMDASNPEESLIRPVTAFDSTNNVFVSKPALYLNGKGLYYDGNKIGQYEQLVATTNGAKVIRIPLQDKDNPEFYRNGTFSLRGTYSTLDFVGYDEEMKTSDYILWYYDSNAGDYFNGDDQCIVTGVSSQLDENGDLCDVIDVYRQGSSYTYTAESGVADELEIGDVWYFDVNASNHIRKHKKGLKISEETFEEGKVIATDSTTYLMDMKGILVGTAIKIEGSNMTFTPDLRRGADMPQTSAGKVDATQVPLDVFDISSAAVFKYTVVKGQPIVEKVTLNDIITFAVDQNQASTLVMNKSGAVRQLYIIQK